MSDRVLYRETLPRYVFKGDLHSRGRIRLVQWWYRLGAIAMILISLDLICIDHSFDEVESPIMFGITMVLTWTGCAYLLYRSEFDHQAQLDGSLATVVYDDRITIPPRLRRRLTDRPDHVRKDEVDHLEVVRGRGTQYFTEKDRVVWKEAPIGLNVVTTSGKVHRLGYKPPSTVREMCDIISREWGVATRDPGSGMGVAIMIVGGKVDEGYTYDDIIDMDILVWQE